ncbi:APC family permease [bacterium 210820-DFI.6.37]|nr:APC family permease [bacterium 210820-DFI.6.37]
MEQRIGTDGVAGLKKYDIKVTGIVFMLYCLVGAGAFGIEEMIPEAGPGMTLLLLVIFPIIWAYPISNMVAECGAVLPSEGGVYVWVREAFGEFWGFQAGWWATVSTYITNGVYVSLVAGYVSQTIEMSEPAIHALKIGMIVIFTIINLMGVKEVEKVSTFLSILIVLAFALVAVVGFLNWNTNPVQPMMPEDYNILDSLSGGICICVWMYCGYECISNMAGEVKNPQVIPKGLIIAMPLVALTYVLPTLGGLACLPEGSWQNWTLSEEGMAADKVGYSTILTTYLGETWGYIFLIIAIISQCAIFNTYLASGSRGFFVLADDNLCPKFMVKVSKKKGVPYIGILSLAVVTLILAQSDFTTLVSTEVVFILAMYILLSISVIKLRKKIPPEERKKQGLYVMPGGKLGLVFFAGFPILISVFALVINGSDYFFMGIVATGTGPIVYLIFKWLYGGLYKLDPENNPLNKKTRLAYKDTLRIGLYMIIAGLFSFFAELWLHWYEIDYGEWGPDDYDMFSDFIPQIMQFLKWGGLILAAAGVVLALIGRKVETKENVQK